MRPRAFVIATLLPASVAGLTAFAMLQARNDESPTYRAETAVAFDRQTVLVKAGVVVKLPRGEAVQYGQAPDAFYFTFRHGSTLKIPFRGDIALVYGLQPEDESAIRKLLASVPEYRMEVTD